VVVAMPMPAINLEQCRVFLLFQQRIIDMHAAQAASGKLPAAASGGKSREGRGAIR